MHLLEFQNNFNDSNLEWKLGLGISWTLESIFLAHSFQPKSRVVKHRPCLPHTGSDSNDQLHRNENGTVEKLLGRLVGERHQINTRNSHTVFWLDPESQCWINPVDCRKQWVNELIITYYETMSSAQTYISVTVSSDFKSRCYLVTEILQLRSNSG